MWHFSWWHHWRGWWDIFIFLAVSAFNINELREYCLENCCCILYNTFPLVILIIFLGLFGSSRSFYWFPYLSIYLCLRYIPTCRTMTFSSNAPRQVYLFLFLLFLLVFKLWNTFNFKLFNKISLFLIFFHLFLLILHSSFIIIFIITVIITITVVIHTALLFLIKNEKKFFYMQKLITKIISDEKFAFLVPSVQAAICLLFAAVCSGSARIIHCTENALVNVLRCDPVCSYFFLSA